MGLATALRDQTKALHGEAERTGVMAALLRGQASREAYVRLLASLHAIYDALERALGAHASHPVVGPLHEPRFARTAALEQDLLGAAGPQWRTLAPAPDRAREYAAHVAFLGAAHPERLLAHAWLRYLGDLNGGQVLARLVRRTEALAGIPTHFYDFPALADPRADAAAWRARLDALDLDEPAIAALVAEAADGFRRHIALFRDLDPQGPARPSTSAA